MKRAVAIIAPIAASIAALAACQVPAQAEGVLAPAATRVAAEPAGLKTAIFAGGCFWGIEAVFSHLNGVTSAVSGYRGGTLANPTYERVSDGNTGHAEAVRVTYDPARIRYDQLLRVFFSVGADPTQLNYQGPDHGTQYRSALVPLSPEQRTVAAAYLAQLSAARIWRGPIVTRIEAPGRFYPAEAEHQDFMLANPNHGYIVRYDAPKVAALRRLFPAQYRAAFVRG